MTYFTLLPKKMHSRDYNSPEILRNLNLSKNLFAVISFNIFTHFMLKGWRSCTTADKMELYCLTVLKKHINNQIPGRKEIHICTAEKMLYLKIHTILVFRSFKYLKYFSSIQSCFSVCKRSIKICASKDSNSLCWEAQIQPMCLCLLLHFLLPPVFASLDAINFM